MLSPRTTTRGRATAGAGAAGAGFSAGTDGAAATAGAGFAGGPPALEPPMPPGTASEAAPHAVTASTGSVVTSRRTAAANRRDPRTDGMALWTIIALRQFLIIQANRRTELRAAPGSPEPEPHLDPPSRHVDPFHFLIRLVEGVGDVDIGLCPAETAPDPQGRDPVVTAIRPLGVGDVR